jgi:hypothetical protein
MYGYFPAQLLNCTNEKKKSPPPQKKLKKKKKKTFKFDEKAPLAVISSCSFGFAIG